MHCTEIDPNAGARGGVLRDKKTGQLIAAVQPTLDATGRTVRVHEADHCAYSPEMLSKRKPSWITKIEQEASKIGIQPQNIFTLTNGIEDSRISMLPVWDKRPLSVQRDAAATALRELKHTPALIARSLDPLIPRDIRESMRASAYNTALRDSALLRMATRNGVKLGDTIKKLAEQLQAAMPHLTLALNAVKDGNLDQAVSHVLADNIPIPKPPMPDLPKTSLQEADPDYEDEANHEGTISGPEKLDPLRQFFLIKPALSQPCLTPGESDPQPEQASCGYRIRRSCLSQIALGLPVARPFTRTLAPSPSGVVLVDASSSMRCTNELLRQVCKLAPAHTVLYYSGSSGKIGNLVIYAKDGLRLADSMPLPNHHGNNACDDLALSYALAEHAKLGCQDPVIFVTDSGFSVSETFKIVEKACAEGRLRLIDSIQAALDEFRGEQTLNA